MNREDILKMEAGAEMDTLVAEKVMGWHIVTDELGRTHWEDDAGHWGAGMNQNPDFSEDEEDFHILHWHPSESLLWAWEVWEWLIEQERFPTLHSGIDESGLEITHGVSLVNPATDELLSSSAPLAICKAALLAVMEEK